MLAADAFDFRRQLVGWADTHRGCQRRAKTYRRLLIAQLELEHHPAIAAMTREEVRKGLERLAAVRR